jgi:UDP-glucose 4-epimerase
VAYRPDQVMHLEADISRLHSATGWQPITELDDGIRATVAFEKHGKPPEKSSPTTDSQ